MILNRGSNTDMNADNGGNWQNERIWKPGMSGFPALAGASIDIQNTVSSRDTIGVTEAGDPVFDLSWLEWVFDERRPAILISKNPHRLFEIVKENSDKFDFVPNIIVHCTITGFGGTKIEPNVPDSDTALRGYYDFVDFLGEDRVVLRCDPLFPTKEAVQIALKTVLAKNAKGTRIRISFLDFYRHVVKRFEEIGYDYTKIGLSEDRFHASIDECRFLVKMICDDPSIDSGMVSACGEPGISSEPCVSKRDCDILGVKWYPSSNPQRPICRCAGNKHELLSARRQCPYGCVYCYWKN